MATIRVVKLADDTLTFWTDDPDVWVYLASVTGADGVNIQIYNAMEAISNGEEYHTEIKEVEDTQLGDC